MSEQLLGEVVSPTPLVDKLEAPHELLYADQVMAIGFGPFVSRVTLGVENHATASRTPVITLVMPTNMLHLMAKRVAAELDSDEAREQISNGHTQYMNSIGG